jgi:hypothetical protein
VPEIMLGDALVFVAVIASGLAAGGMLIFLVGILPIRERMGAVSFVQFHQLSSPLIDRVIPPGIVVSALAAVGALAGGKSGAAVLPLVVGILSSVAVITISLAVNFPINTRVKSFALDAVPDEQRELFQKWHRFHAIRTPIALAAFGAYVVAALAG